MFETPRWAAWSEHGRVRMLTRVSQVVVRNIRPSLTVFDCFPSRAMLNAVIQQNTPIVLCLREMRELSKYLEHIRHLLPYLTSILIPHEPGAFEIPESIRTKSQFVGRIVRPFVHSNRTASDSSAPRVVITGGGGGFPDTVRFYNLALQATVALRRTYPSLESILVTGPLFQDWSRLSIVEGVKVIPFEPDIMETFSDADIVISSAGYNTAAELEQVGVKAILVPGVTSWDDQYARAERLTRAHAHFRTFTGSLASELAGLVETLLREPACRGVTEAKGADKAASHLRSLLDAW